MYPFFQRIARPYVRPYTSTDRLSCTDSEPPLPGIPPSAEVSTGSPSPVDTSRQQKEDPTPPFPIVGIGASAGGLQAFEAFFQSMPSDSGIAFVIVQHLDPTHQSILAEIVDRYTRMTVQQVTDGIQVQPDHVYVIPPNRDMALMQNHLHLIEPTKSRGLRLPIDFFFRSLADELHKHAIGIIFSGTGTDGTLGLRAIKGTGGMVMVQEPSSARYDGMLRSAMDTNLVDYILPVEQMPEQLLQYIKHDFIAGARQSTPLSSQSSDTLHKIFILLRNQTGHDLSMYKKSTILRRIERRMAINQISWINDYIRYLQQNSQELMTLFREIFIGVTGFFRDPEAFQALEQRVLPRIFEQASPQESIRVWVPGCSTGEEAFSLAILLREQVQARQQHNEIQIFATDIDSQAIARARTGVFPASIEADTPPKRLQYFTNHDNDTYVVNKDIRSMVVFAEHSVIKDPPFSNIDLISCRNLLIYLENKLQQRVLELFHRALKPERFLFLGTSETTGAASSLFTTIDHKWQIYQQLPSTNSETTSFDFDMPTLPDPEHKQKPGTQSSTRDLRKVTEQLLLNHYAPASVVLNEKGDMLYFYGKTGKYWEPPTGKAEWNVFRVAHEDLQLVLTITVRQAFSNRKDIIRKEAHFGSDDNRQTVYISARLIPDSRLMLLVFEEQIPTTHPLPPEPDLNAEDERDAYVLKLQQDLKEAHEYLHATNEELQATNEELQSSNEELQSSNEELRSSNEELSTSKEELQSVNEELVTVNAELQEKISELSRANNYLRNLLTNIDVGIIFLDMNLHISWFTPTATSVIHLIDSDIGRPLSDLVPNIDYSEVIADAEHVLNTLEIRSAEVRIRDSEEWFWMRIAPYRTTDNIIEGVVLTFSNISQQKHTQADLRKLTEAVEQGPGMVLIVNKEGIIEYVNPCFSQITGYEYDEVIGQHLRTIKADPESLALHEAAWNTVLSGQDWHGEFKNRKKNGDYYWVAAWRAPVRDEHGTITHVVAIENDITEQKQRTTELHASERLLSSIYSGLAVPIFVIDVSEDERFYYAGVNPACERIVGFRNEQVQGKYLEDLQPLLGTAGIERLQKRFGTVVATGEALEYEQRFATPTQPGEGWWMTRLEPLTNEEGRVYRIIATTHSRTELKHARAAVERCEALLASLGNWWYTVNAQSISAQAMIQQMCRLLVDAGSCQAAWGGLLARANRADILLQTYAVASANPTNEPLAPAWITETAAPVLSQLAQQSNEAVVIDDIGSDARAEDWQAAALQNGYSALVALPFAQQADPIGLLIVFLPASQPFTETDLRAIYTLAHNLEQGLAAHTDILSSEGSTDDKI